MMEGEFSVAQSLFFELLELFSDNVEDSAMTVFGAFALDYHVAADSADGVYCLPSEPQIVKLLISPVLRRRPFLAHKIEAVDADPVIYHLYPLLPILSQDNLDIGGLGIDGVIDEFFDAVGEGGDDLLRAEIFGGLLRESFDHLSGNLSKRSIVYSWRDKKVSLGYRSDQTISLASVRPIRSKWVILFKRERCELDRFLFIVRANRSSTRVLSTCRPPVCQPSQVPRSAHSGACSFLRFARGRRCIRIENLCISRWSRACRIRWCFSLPVRK
jgi:hypothetical protein